MSDGSGPEIEFGIGAAKMLYAFREADTGFRKEAIQVALIDGYSRIVAAQIAASASAGSILEQAAAVALGGGADPAREFEPDDANVVLYEGNPAVYGHTVSLKGGGKVVIVQDRENTGYVTVKFARDVRGQNTIHTVVFDENGIAQ